MTKHTVFALTAIAAVWAVAAPAHGQQQRSEITSAAQADPSQEACIARRKREGLNTRFATRRCVNPYN